MCLKNSKHDYELVGEVDIKGLTNVYRVYKVRCKQCGEEYFVHESFINDIIDKGEKEE